MREFKYILIICLFGFWLPVLISQPYCIPQEKLNNSQRVLRDRLGTRRILDTSQNCNFQIKFNDDDELYIYEKSSKRKTDFQTFKFPDGQPSKRLDTLVTCLVFYSRNWANLSNKKWVKENLELLVDSCFLLGAQELNIVIDQIDSMTTFNGLNLLQKICKDSSRLFFSDRKKCFVKYKEFKDLIKHNESLFSKASEEFEKGNFTLAEDLFKQINTQLFNNSDLLNSYLKQCKLLKWNYDDKICDTCKDSLLLWIKEVPLKVRKIIASIVGVVEKNGRLDIDSICHKMLPGSGFINATFIVGTDEHMKHIENILNKDPLYFKKVMDLGMLKDSFGKPKCFLFIGTPRDVSIHLKLRDGKNNVYCLQ